MVYQGYQIERGKYRFGIGSIEKKCNPFGEEKPGNVTIWIFERDIEGYEVDIVQEGEEIGDTGIRVLTIGKRGREAFIVVD